MSVFRVTEEYLRDKFIESAGHQYKANPARARLEAAKVLDEGELVLKMATESWRGLMKSFHSQSLKVEDALLRGSESEQVDASDVLFAVR